MKQILIMRRISIVLALLLFAAVNSAFMRALPESEQGRETTYDEAAENYLIPMLEALNTHDIDKMYEIWIDQAKESEKFIQLFEDLVNSWNGRKWNELRKISQTQRPVNGKAPSATIYRYQALDEKDVMEIEFAVIDSLKRVDSITFTPADTSSEGSGTGRQFNLLRWLFVGLAWLEFLFSIYMVFLCIKNKTRLWGLWLIFILAAYIGISFPVRENIILTFFIRMYGPPRIIFDQGVMSEVYLSVPIGAIIYYFKHKLKN